MKQAFSLLEIIIVVVIISIISSLGIYKLFSNLDNANSLQVKTQINLIKNAITKKYNENVLLAVDTVLENLDDKQNNTKNQMLFTHILNQIILSTNETQKEFAKWIKVSANSYKIYLSNTQSVTFYYDSASATFDCDYTNDTCKELYQ